MRTQAPYIFALLTLSFLAFSLCLYLKPAFGAEIPNSETELASEGKLVWQKYNCQSCHQLYGLGGYLGPDLTNVMSTPGKGAPWVEVMLKVGKAPMPVFVLSGPETAQLIAFLKSADASGSADPRNFAILATGMTDRK